MGHSYGRYAAGKLADELYERALGTGHSLAARGALPRSADEFAHAVVHATFGALVAGLGLLNQRDGWHPDDPRWDAPPDGPAGEPPQPRTPMIGSATEEARRSSGWTPKPLPVRKNDGDAMTRARANRPGAGQ